MGRAGGSVLTAPFPRPEGCSHAGNGAGTMTTATHAIGPTTTHTRNGAWADGGWAGDRNQDTARRSYDSGVGELTNTANGNFRGKKQSGRAAASGCALGHQLGERIPGSDRSSSEVSYARASPEDIINGSCPGWGLELEGEVYVDSSAALGVVARRGAGKLRHVRVGQLWIQEKAEEGELAYRKIKGTSNPADALTKSLNGLEIARYITMMGLTSSTGRAEKGLEIA